MNRALHATGEGPAIGDIEAARRRIRTLVRTTPLERSAFLSERAGSDVHLKLECWQTTRSFKVRGAANAIARLSAAERTRGVVAASTGNHGQAVALAAARTGTSVTIFAPRTAPESKRRRMRALGATLDDAAADYDAAEAAASAHAESTGAVLIHPYSDPAVVAGQGTIALEIMDELGAVADVVVPVGGGGLLAGIGIAYAARSPQTRIVGVQSERTRAMHDAIAAGQLVDSPITPTLADGLAGCTDQVALERATRVIDGVHLVSETAIAEAMRLLFVHDGVVAEGSAAVGVAALLAGVIHPRGPSVFVITGGNVDPAAYASILADA